MPVPHDDSSNVVVVRAAAGATFLSKKRHSEARDDGAIVFLNGAEIGRVNMPSGSITATTLAPITIDKDRAFLSFTAAVSALRTGDNELAVEVHQAAVTSSDIRLDVELSARAP